MDEPLGQPQEPWLKPAATFPPPLDLTVSQPDTPFLVKAGPGFEWREGHLYVLFAIPNGPVMWRQLEPDESRRLLEWMLKSVEANGG